MGPLRISFFGLIVLASLSMPSFYSSSSQANAAKSYVETSVGMTNFTKGEAFFGYDSANAPGVGVTFPLTIGMNLSSRSAFGGFHLGMQYRYSSASSDERNYNLQSAYLLARLATRRLYLSGGYTPFILKNGFSRANRSMAYLAEVGANFPVTPELDIIASSTWESIQTDGVWGTASIFSASVGLRFHLNAPYSRGRSELDSDWKGYKGWRYPYGIEVH